MRAKRIRPKSWNGKSPRKTAELSEAATCLLRAIVDNEISIFHDCQDGAPWNSIGIIVNSGDHDIVEPIAKTIGELYSQGYVQFQLSHRLDSSDSATYVATKLGRMLMKPPARLRSKKTVDAESLPIRESESEVST